MWCVPELNEEYIRKMEDVLEVYEAPYNPQEPVVCLDEKPITLHADVRPPSAAAPGREARRDSEYERRGTANVFCAIEPKSWLNQAEIEIGCFRDSVWVHGAFQISRPSREKFAPGIARQTAAVLKSTGSSTAEQQVGSSAIKRKISGGQRIRNHAKSPETALYGIDRPQAPEGRAIRSAMSEQAVNCKILPPHGATRPFIRKTE